MKRAEVENYYIHAQLRKKSPATVDYVVDCRLPLPPPKKKNKIKIKNKEDEILSDHYRSLTYPNYYFPPFLLSIILIIILYIHIYISETPVLTLYACSGSA